MVMNNILRVKHLPKELSHEEKEEFLQHFGAVQVKLVNYPNGKSVAFAKFENAEVTRAVLFRLHQLTVLSSRLSVDFAENDIGEKQPKLKKIEEEDNTQKKCFKNFIVKLHSFNQSVGFHQPPPPHLKYEYPKANRPTINNIAHVLATVPKFYTQVLHLMNRMNLPPPFVIETHQVKQQVSTSSQKQTMQPQPAQKQNSTSESEIESDDDSKSKDVIPEKQFTLQKKGIKRPKFIKPNVKQVIPSKIIKTEEIFEKSDLSAQRKIELKVSSDSLEKMEMELQNNPRNEVPSEESHPKDEKRGYCISDEDLKNNQIPLKDLGVLPIFKDYHPGIPSNRLYVKNIAKNVKLEDLEYIFKRYKIESETSLFDIRLMQEGRMKGQAFVTVDNTQVAQKAVEETNGFILKDKPLVVVFGRSSVTKPKN